VVLALSLDVILQQQLTFSFASGVLARGSPAAPTLLQSTFLLFPQCLSFCERPTYAKLYLTVHCNR